MKIYTRTGDKGITSLWDGKRKNKSDDIFSIIGEVDELTSRIGLLTSSTNEYSNVNRYIQSILQLINSHLATTTEKKRKKLQEITLENVSIIEEKIDEIDEKNKKLTGFILPGIKTSDSYSHLCRTQARKVERFLWKWVEDNEIDYFDIILKFVNRISDYFFALARFLCNEYDDIFLFGKECEL